MLFKMIKYLKFLILKVLPINFFLIKSGSWVLEMPANQNDDI